MIATKCTCGKALGGYCNGSKYCTNIIPEALPPIYDVHHSELYQSKQLVEVCEKYLILKIECDKLKNVLIQIDGQVNDLKDTLKDVRSRVIKNRTVYNIITKALNKL